MSDWSNYEQSAMDSYRSSAIRAEQERPRSCLCSVCKARRDDVRAYGLLIKPVGGGR